MEEIKKILKEKFLNAVSFSEFRDELTVIVEESVLYPVLSFLRKDPICFFDFLTDLTAVDYYPDEPRFAIIYTLYSFKFSRRIRVKCYLSDKEPYVKSVCNIWKGANWMEREVYDLFGIHFADHPNLKRILLWENFSGHPFRKDFPLDTDIPNPSFEDVEDVAEENTIDIPLKDRDIKVDILELNIGPQHPATHGVFRLRIYLDGENVVKAEPIIGYLHRGSEKIMENLPYLQAMVWTDRMDYVAPILNNFGYVLAVEKLLGVNPPKRAQYIRIILGELTRIASHLIWLGTHALDLGITTVFMYTFRERERIYDFLEKATGQRMNNSFFRIGGIAADLPDKWISELKDYIPFLKKAIDEYEALLTKNEIFLMRTKNIGVISPDLAVSLSLTGPPLRASGVRWDIRKVFPYSSYDEFDFTLPTGEKGDVYDRFLVRMEEMRQSINIIEQAIKNLPLTDVLIRDFKVLPPEKDKVYNSIEEMIHHFEIMTMGIIPPKGEVYASVEGAKGELGFYIVSDGTRKPWRVRVRPPSFINLQSLEYILKGHLISDVVAIIGSLDPVFGEVDR